MILPDGVLEYLMTAGIAVALVGLIAGLIIERKNIGAALRASGFERSDLLLAVAIVLVFIAVEAYLVMPTQLLFFDDAIYQAMAQQLIHTGQAWMCNYGTPSGCYSGQVFHEPIGLSFNFAIAFAMFGVRRGVAYAAELALAALSVFMSFFVALLLFKERRAAFLSELMLGISPVVLVWAMPTNSDMAMLAYSLIAMFTVLVLARKRSVIGLSNVLLAIAMLLYMKIDAAIYVPILAAVFVLLADKSIAGSLRRAWHEISANLLNTKLLVVLLIFIIAVYPAALYAYGTSNSSDYGYSGTTVQNTCSSGSITAQGTINSANFKANLCANLLYWINKYRGSYVIQPLAFTILAILGAVALAFLSRGRLLATFGIWFIPIFLLYTSFYAGSVLYGVDWRFMLGLVAQAALLGGFALSKIVGGAEHVAGMFARHRRYIKAITGWAVMAAVVAFLFYVIYLQAPLLAVSPANIPQAGDARFYENLVYNSSYKIPQGCLVYTYDPTLFNINNRTATQMGDLYDPSFYANASAKYGCSVIDIGYWCYTPGNICDTAYSEFNITPIATAKYPPTGNVYGFYRLAPRG